MGFVFCGGGGGVMGHGFRVKGLYGGVMGLGRGLGN